MSDYLTNRFQERCIGRGGQLYDSPNLNPLDYYLWGLEEMVYVTSVDNKLTQRIENCCQQIYPE